MTCAADAGPDGRPGESARRLGERRDAPREKQTQTETTPTTWRYFGPSAEDAAFDPLPVGLPELVEEIRRVERVALTDLYRVTEGSRWRRQRNWLSRKTHCAWEGVFCASTTRPPAFWAWS